jgi:hypothetical protein
MTDKDLVPASEDLALVKKFAKERSHSRKLQDFLALEKLTQNRRFVGSSQKIIVSERDSLSNHCLKDGGV